MTVEIIGKGVKGYISDGSSFTDDSSSDDAASTIEQRTELEKKLLRRLDIRLIPILMLIYTVNYLDRINISNAITLGLPVDLGLQGNQLNIALVVFFASYIPFELPTNFFLQKFKPHVWISGCLFACGLIVLGHGYVKSYGGFVAVRVLLGACEAGVLPGCTYLLTMWYTRDEALRRFAIFANGSALAGSFGSLLASAIATLDGKCGIAGWRWIFIIEGAATCLVAVLVYFVCTDFPEDAKWLTARDRQVVLDRLQADQPDVQTQTAIKEGIINHFSDPKSYCIGAFYFGLNIAMYAIGYFLPTILSTYGYSRIQTQLYTAAPFAVGVVWSTSLAFVSTWLKQRLVFVIVSLGVSIAGVCILLTVHENKELLYGATFLFTIGNLGAAPIAVCWYFMNLRGHTERAIGTAWVIGCGNAGGIVSTFSFLEKERPHYHTGYSIVLFSFCLAVAGATGYSAFCRLTNRGLSGNKRLIDH